MKFLSFQTFIHQINHSLHVSLTATFLIEIFSAIQIIHLIFTSMATFSPSSQFIILSLDQNLKFLTGAFPLQETSIYNKILHAVWIIILIYFVLHILLFLFMTKIILKYNNESSNRIIKILSWLYLLHSRIIFFPIQFFLLNLANLYSSPRDPIDTKFYQQTGWLIASVILIIINSALAICKEFIMYQINHNKNGYAVKSNLYHQTIILYKIFALLLYFWGITGTSNAFKGSTILHLIFGLILMTLLSIKLPFYNFQVLKLVIILTTTILCLSFTSIIYVFSTDAEVIGAMHILVLLLPPLGVKVVLSQYQNLFKRILRGEFLLTDHAIHFGLLIEEFLVSEQNNLPEDLSFLPNRESFFGILAQKNILLSNEQEIYLYIIDRLTLTKQSPVLSLFLAQIYLKKLENIPKVLEIMRKLETNYSTSKSLPMQSSIQYINYLLQKAYNEDDVGFASHLGLSHYFKYYDLANKIKALMLTETKKQIELWEQVRLRNLDAKKLYDQSQNIDRLFVKIRKECEHNLNNFRKNFSSPMLLYSVYLNNVRQMHYDGIQVLRSFQTVMLAQNISNQFDAASGNVAVVIVSLDKTKAGVILNASGSIHNIFNLRKTELIGKKIGCLFPSVIAKNYQQNIQQYSKAPLYKLDYKEKTYGKTTNDEIFELDAHFQLYPYINKELTMMIMLKKLDDPAPILIANNDGLIIDCSKTLQTLFHSENLNLKVFRSLQNINSDFEDVNLAFNLLYQQQDEVTMTKEKSVFPNNFDNTASDFQDNSTSKYTSRSLLHNYGNSSERIKHFKSTLAPDLTLDKAELICQEYLEGKQVVMCPDFATPLQRKYRLRALVQIKPYISEGDVYKVMRITNLKRDATTFHESEENTSSPYDNEDSILTFGDEFPVDNEKVIVRKISPTKQTHINKKPQKSQTLASSSIKKSQSVELENNDDENNHNEATQKKLNNIQQNIWDQDDQRSSIMNSNHQESRTVRTLRDIGSRKKLQPGLSSLQISLYFVIIAVLILAIIKFGFSKSSIEEIEKGINIINLVTLRLQNVINSWFWSLILMTEPTANVVVPFIKSNTEKFANYNTELKGELGLLEDQRLINRAFERDITFWQLAVQGDSNSNIVDTFTATDILLTKYLAIQNVQTGYQLYLMPDLLQIFNNTSNDYILSSSRLIDSTDTILQEIIDRDIKLLDVVLALEIIALTAYISIFTAMLYLISRSYQRLCRALNRTQETSVAQRINQLTKVKNLLEDDIERKAFIQDAFDILIEERSSIQSSSKDTAAKSQKTNNQPVLNMRLMNKHLFRITMMSLLFIPVFVGLFVGTLIKSIHTFNSLGSVNEELSVLSYGCLQSSFLMSTIIYSLVFGSYPNMMFRNQAISAQISENLINFNNLNQKLIETFLSSSEREIDPFVVEILQSDVCKYLNDASKYICSLATNDQKMGLLSMNTDYYNTIYAIVGAMSSSATLSELLVLYSSLLSKLNGEMHVMEDIYPVMISHILEDFDKTVEQSKDNEVSFIVAIILVVILYAGFIYWKPMRSIRRVDLGRRKILKILPVSIVQENKALKFYLMQDFKTEIEQIKNAL